MNQNVKKLKAQYKNWSCYQAPYARSGSGCVQHIVCNDLQFKKDITDKANICSTKRQLYRFLKWYVESGQYSDTYAIVSSDSNGPEAIEEVLELVEEEEDVELVELVEYLEHVCVSERRRRTKHA